MSYPQSVEYLYALGNELKAGAKFGLERMRALMNELGNPERHGRIVHVAGTNGKGSTCATIAAAAKAAGLRTGLNTSPHLVEPTERIQIDGESIGKEEFAQAFEVVHAAAERLLTREAIDVHPSFFETVTAMAFVVFRERHCDLNVIEVGLGGRLDATNIVIPELTVITPVSFDHEAFLGNTIQSIAAGKSGHPQTGVPLILGKQMPEAESVITAAARQLSCRISRVADQNYTYIGGNQFSFDGEVHTSTLPGRHQIDNAIAAILTARHLGIGMDAIRNGMAGTRWPGRLELVSRNPNFILDGAHNPAGATALAKYIREFCSGSPVWMVYGAMRDKAIEEVTTTLFAVADHLIVTAPQFPRALRPESILETCSHPHAEIAPTVELAIQRAREAPPNANVFFTGSLYLVGEARRSLLTRTR